MKRFSATFLLLLLMAFGALSREARQFLHFDKSSSGLAYDGVKTIIQDSRSYIWAGTYKGLSRYDGTRWKSYDRNDFGTGTDYISSMAEDACGNIWLGTDSGPVVYSYVEDAFTCLSSSGCPSDRVYDIIPDSDRGVYLAIRNHGLYHYDTISKALQKLPLPSEEHFYRLALSPDGRLFAASYCKNLYLVGEDKLTSLWGDFFRSDNIEGLAIEGNSLYVASKRHGLCRLGLYDGTLDIICPLRPDVRPVNVGASAGLVWFSTTDGLRVYDPSTGGLEHIRMNPSDRFGLKDNHITSAFVDSRDGLWVSSENGIDYAGPAMTRITRVECPGIARSFAQDPSGLLWVGTERKGLLTYDISRGRLSAYQNPSLPRSVNALCADGPYVWLGSHGGIYRIEASSGAVRKYALVAGSNPNADNRVISLFLSREGCLYAATNIGVSRYDRQSDTFLPIDALQDITVESMAQESSGRIWMASYSQGAYLFDPAKGSIAESWCCSNGNCSIPEMTSSVCIDRQGCPWIIGFSSGLWKKTPEGFEHFDRKTLPTLPTDVYYTALPDRSGRLWISSDAGLIRFDSGSVRLYTREDGLLSESFRKGGLLLRDSRMVFGSEEGFILFDPARLQDSMVACPVAITSVRVNGELPSDAVFRGNPDLASRMMLGPRERNLSIRVATPGISLLASGPICCKLEGLESDWRDISTSGNYDYFNLPKGHFTLRIARQSPDGNWEDAHMPVSITVRPRFFESVAGIILVLILAILVAAGISVLVSRRNLAKQRNALYHEKMQFFANVIHEIKTPLTLIRTPLQHLLARGDLSPDSRKDVELIADNSESMERLVRELLEFISLEEHGIVLEKTECDIVDSLGFILYNYSETARSANLRLEFRHSLPSLPARVDRRAFNKMVNNLMSNAVKYAASYIVLDLQSGPSTVEIRVSNDGERIPVERREDIFKPFVHFGTSSHRADSFGIGLSYARRLARLHGGDITLSDREDCTEFILSLPLGEEPASEQREPSAQAARSDTSLPLVLLVEDNSELLGYLKRRLSQDYRVLAVDSAEKALDKLFSTQVDLLVTDLGLKSMSGVELCSRVNANPATAHIPIIVLSAISSVSTKIQCMENGATMYIEKPFSMDYLESCIKAALQKRSSMRNAYAPLPDAVSRIGEELSDKDESFIRRLDALITDNISDPEFSNSSIETLLGISRSSLNRKVRSLLDTTPNEYIRTKRLSAAALILERGGVRISEVCYAVGFNSPSYFAKCFREKYGMLPVEYAKIHNNK